MRKISTETLLRRVQHELNVIRKLNPKEADPKTFKLYLEKARVMGYLASVMSQILTPFRLPENPPENPSDISEPTEKEKPPLTLNQRWYNGV